MVYIRNHLKRARLSLLSSLEPYTSRIIEVSTNILPMRVSIGLHSSEFFIVVSTSSTLVLCSHSSFFTLFLGKATEHLLMGSGTASAVTEKQYLVSVSVSTTRLVVFVTAEFSVLLLQLSWCEVILGQK